MSEQVVCISKYPDIFGALAAPFEANEVKERSQGGRTISYITSRTAQNRLDEVVGPENWRVSYRETPKGVVCTIGIRLPTGEWLDKEDAGGFPGMVNKDGELDEENDVKAGYADGFKKASACWGIGRYLWRDGVPSCFRGTFDPGRGGEPQARHDPGSGGGGGGGGSTQRPPRNDGGRPGFPDTNRAPNSGKGLFAWAKKAGEAIGQPSAWVEFVNGRGKARNFPDRMVDWNDTEVAAVWDDVVANIRSQEAKR